MILFSGCKLHFLLAVANANDGASNISGSRNGAASKITVEEKRAVYTQCYTHALKLAVGDTIKRSEVFSDALDTAFEITKLINFSPKRNAAFDRIKTEVPQEDCGSIWY